MTGSVPREVSQMTAQELAGIFGGEVIGGTSFAHDLGYAIGWFFGKVDAFLDAAPASNYAYCKTGLS